MTQWPLQADGSRFEVGVAYVSLFYSCLPSDNTHRRGGNLLITFFTLKRRFFKKRIIIILNFIVAKRSLQRSEIRK